MNLQADVRSVMNMAASSSTLIRPYNFRYPIASKVIYPWRYIKRGSFFHGSVIAKYSTNANVVVNKPSICTADELHYVEVPGTEWQLALWRYFPSLEAPSRNHPLLLLSGVATNAIGYDLSSGSSFARNMSRSGFDTWVLELRGAGLSKRAGSDVNENLLLNSMALENRDSAVKKEVVNEVHLMQEDMTAKANGSNKSGALAAKANGSNKSVDPTAKANGSNKSGDLPAKANGSKKSGDSGLTAKANDSDKSGSDSLSLLDKSDLVSKLSETIMQLTERLSGFLNEGQFRTVSDKLFNQISRLLEDSHLIERFDEIQRKISGLIEVPQNNAITSQITDLSQRLINIMEEGQRSVSPLYDLQERLSTTIDDFRKQLDLIIEYNWDFEDYLKEDVPAAMEYILSQSHPKDGKLLAVGHSMGGILLYAMLSRHGSEGSNAMLAAAVTLASSLDYTSSRSSLKLLLPLANPVQALNVPVVPLGVLMSTTYPLSAHPPYVMSWLNAYISSQDMMHPELLKKLVLNNFCTVPAKVLLQLTTAFRDGGLRDRSGTFIYKDHLHKCDVPILAVAGDEDLICPLEAVLETVKHIPPHLRTYRLFGEPNDHHYAHYDLVGGRKAVDEVYPCIIEFLSRHDKL